MASERQGKSSGLLRFTEMSSSSVDKATLPTHVPLDKKKKKRLQEFVPEANLGPKTDFPDVAANKINENTAKECLPIRSEEVVVKQEV